ncbi:hypothetical protein ACFFX0_21800 [Citricoccus parietis]|uniref:Uncharacterized protein n=1 Tax=Citricoccus parietis TaxID=592307 RepID=A0ABV5G428_9MICC
MRTSRLRSGPTYTSPSGTAMTWCTWSRCNGTRAPTCSAGSVGVGPCTPPPRAWSCWLPRQQPSARTCWPAR